MTRDSTANERLRDASLRVAHSLEKYKNQEVRRILAVLNDQTFPAIVELLNKRLAKITERGYDRGVETTKRLRDLRDAIDIIVKEGLRRAQQRLVGDLKGLSLTAADLAQRDLANAVFFDTDIVAPSPGLLHAIVTSRPFSGALLSDHFDSLTVSSQRNITKALNIGLVAGETFDQIANRIVGTKALKYRDGTFETSRRNVKSVVGSAVQFVGNSARQETYKENSDIVKEEQWLATLDTRTCEECASLDGQVFPLGEGTQPPVHLGPCRCVRVPVLKSWRELGFDVDEVDTATRASMNGQVPDSVTYGEWIETQSNDDQDEALGPKRAALLRSGEVKFDQFTNDEGQQYTLEELRKRNGLPPERKNTERPPTEKDAPPPTQPDQKEVERKAEEERQAEEIKKKEAEIKRLEKELEEKRKQDEIEKALAESEADNARRDAERIAQARIDQLSREERLDKDDEEHKRFVAADRAKRLEVDRAEVAKTLQPKLDALAEAEAQWKVVSERDSLGLKTKPLYARGRELLDRIDLEKDPAVRAALRAELEVVDKELDKYLDRQRTNGAAVHTLFKQLEDLRNATKADVWKLGDLDINLDVARVRANPTAESIALRERLASMLELPKRKVDVLPENVAQEVVNQFERLMPVSTATKLETFAVDDTLPGAYAAVSRREVDGPSIRYSMNSKFFGSPKSLDKLDVMLKADHVNGHLAAATRSGIIVHEIGHTIEFTVYNGVRVFQHVTDWLLKNKLNAQTLSKYAMKNQREHFAEAFAKLFSRPSTQWSSWEREFAKELAKGYRSLETLSGFKKMPEELIGL